MNIILSKAYYILLVTVLAVMSFVTGEFVTFIMLGFLLMALININTTLKKILEKLDRK